MAELPNEGRIIKARRQAAVVVFVTLFLAGHRFWHIAHGRPTDSGWIYALNSWLPNWAAILANILTYGLFAWFLVVLLIRWRGTERVIAAILIAEVLVSPVRQYLPVAAAQALIWMQAFGEMIMTTAAVHLFLSRSQSASATAT